MEMNHPAITALNLCLAGIACLFAVKLYSVWYDPQNPPSTKATGVGLKPYTLRHQAGTKTRKPIDTYDGIVEGNLFSRDRKYHGGKKSLIPPSEITLYGTLIFGQYKTALLEVKEKEKRGVRRRSATQISPSDRLREVAVGDTIAGYRVADILEDRVILENEAGKSYVVKLQISKERNHVRTSISKVGKGARVSRRRVPKRTTTRSGRTQRR